MSCGKYLRNLKNKQMAFKISGRVISFLILLTLASLFFFTVHSFLYNKIFHNRPLFLSILEIYCFNFLATLILCLLVVCQLCFGKINILSLFIALTLFKMFAVLLFLYPLTTIDMYEPKLDIINFFISYFVFLIFEILSIRYFLQNYLS